MTHDHGQGGAGHLAFPGGGVIAGNSGGGPITIPDDVPTFPLPGGGTIEFVPGSLEQEARAWRAMHGRQYEKDVPEGARVMPSGNWVLIKDPRSLTRGDKRELIRQGQLREGQSPAERVFVVQDLVHTKLITAWSYPFPVPAADPESLNRLPVEDDDAFDDLIAEANALLFPKPVTPDDHADPASPTAPSGE